MGRTTKNPEQSFLRGRLSYAKLSEKVKREGDLVGKGDDVGKLAVSLSIFHISVF